MFILRPSHLLQRRDDKYKFEYYDNDAIVNVVNVRERRWSSLTLSKRKYKSKRRILATFLMKDAEMSGAQLGNHKNLKF